MNQENVVGIAIATRPDCLSEQVLDLLEELNNKIYVWVELGLQTSNENTAIKINRGYNLETFEKAVKSLRKRKIDIVVHTIFGLPGENENDMLNTIKYISNKDIQGIKFHLLHLMKNTPLVNLYNKGQLKFLEKQQYIDIVCKSITLLPESIVIHRLTGDAPRQLLIGPLWSLKKWEILNSINNTLEQRDWYQGQNYNGLYYSTNSF